MAFFFLVTFRICKKLGHRCWLRMTIKNIYIQYYRFCRHNLYASHLSDPFRARAMYRIWKSKLHAEKSNMQKDRVVVVFVAVTAAAAPCCCFALCYTHTHTERNTRTLTFLASFRCSSSNWCKFNLDTSHKKVCAWERKCLARGYPHMTRERRKRWGARRVGQKEAICVITCAWVCMNCN